jgi:hypothetical protein
VTDHTAWVGPQIDGHQCRVFAEHGKRLDGVLSPIGFAAAWAKDRKRYPLGPRARKRRSQPSIVPDI